MAHAPRNPRKHVLTDEQRRMYAAERVINFRFVSRLMASVAPHTLSSDDLASPETQQFLSEIGQYAELAYNRRIPIQLILSNLNELLQPGFPLEGYEALRGVQLLTSFVGTCARLPGYVAYRPQTKQLILAISGTSTESTLQALYDVHTLQHRHPSGRGGVHKGFWCLYKGIRERALDAVRKGLALHDDVAELIVTGHSMGAAVSQLVVLDLLRDPALLPPEHADLPLRYVGFGGPRVGTKRLVKYWRELLAARRAAHGEDSIHEYCVKMYNDGVPNLPPLAFGFRHCAARPYYSVHGRLYHVPAGFAEYSLFRVAPLADGKPLMHPLGGHNYYNGRDMEKSARLIRWLDKAMQKEGDWRDEYRAKVAKHAARMRTR